MLILWNRINFKSGEQNGKLYYDWTQKRQRIDHTSGAYECVHFYNTSYSCSLIFTEDAVSFICLKTHTHKIITLSQFHFDNHFVNTSMSKMLCWTDVGNHSVGKTMLQSVIFEWFEKIQTCEKRKHTHQHSIIINWDLCVFELFRIWMWEFYVQIGYKTQRFWELKLLMESCAIIGGILANTNTLTLNRSEFSLFPFH